MGDTERYLASGVCVIQYNSVKCGQILWNLDISHREWEFVGIHLVSITSPETFGKV